LRIRSRLLSEKLRRGQSENTGFQEVCPGGTGNENEENRKGRVEIRNMGGQREGKRDGESRSVWREESFMGEVTRRIGGKKTKRREETGAGTERQRESSDRGF